MRRLVAGVAALAIGLAMAPVAEAETFEEAERALCTMLDKNPTTATLDAFNDAVSKTNVGDYASVVLGSDVADDPVEERRDGVSGHARAVPGLPSAAVLREQLTELVAADVFQRADAAGETVCAGSVRRRPEGAPRPPARLPLRRLRRGARCATTTPTAPPRPGSGSARPPGRRAEARCLRHPPCTPLGRSSVRPREPAADWRLRSGGPLRPIGAAGCWRGIGSST